MANRNKKGYMVIIILLIGFAGFLLFHNLENKKHFTPQLAMKLFNNVYKNYSGSYVYIMFRPVKGFPNFSHIKPNSEFAQKIISFGIKPTFYHEYIFSSNENKLIEKKIPKYLRVKFLIGRYVVTNVNDCTYYASGPKEKCAVYYKLVLNNQGKILKKKDNKLFLELFKINYLKYNFSAQQTFTRESKHGNYQYVSS